MKDDFKSVPAILAEEVPTYPASPEYGALNQNNISSGWVATEFARYFARLQRAETMGALSVAERDDLRLCYRAIERLASSEDIEVQNLVTIFIFESIDDEDVSDELLRNKLGPNSLSIFLQYGRGIGMDGFGKPIVKGGP